MHVRQENRCDWRRSMSFVAGLAVIAATGCDNFRFGGVTVRGSGTITRDEREVGDFSSIVLQGVGNVEVVQGEARPLEVEADDNLVPLLKSDVKGETLYLAVEPNHNLKPTQPIRFIVQTPAVASLAIHGSGNVVAKGIESEQLAVSVAGTGDIRLGRLNVERLSVSIAGSGNITAAGRAPELSVSIDGTGNFHGAELLAERVDIHSNGVGNAVVNASDELDVQVNGVGSVEYVGSPQVRKTIHGVGSIRQR